MREILAEFVTQNRDNLDRLEADLLALEAEPASRPLVDRIFRGVHTIKGTSGFLGFVRLQKLTHAGEGLLSRLRDGTLAVAPAMVGTLLEMVDAVRRVLVQIDATQEEGEDDHAGLMARLQVLQSEAGAAAMPPASPPPAAAASPEPAPAPAAAEHADTGSREPATLEADHSIRVDVQHLDHLMNLVGELVLTRNQILQLGAQHDCNELSATSQRLNTITSELQEAVMKTRMQPIRNVLGKVPRMARDLAAACGKKVALQMDGEETELDKTLIEAVRDPIAHLVRNCIDHGIESPELRQGRGKPAEGRLCIRAFHEGGTVHLEIGDDGQGMDPERLKSKAVELGILQPLEAARMSDREALELVFRAGFSTASQVTEISGRGVGMDVVRANIEAIGGTIAIQSTLGAGTTFALQIPLTLAILPALLVRSRGERYAIPQASLVELVRLDDSAARRHLEWIDGQPIFRLRGELVPLVHLAAELGTCTHDVWRAVRERSRSHVVVLHADGATFGLVVDDVSDTAEIVVKPLDRRLRDIGVYSGATIMGDGRVALILDVLAIAQRARIVGERGARRTTEPAAVAPAPAVAPARLLLVETAGRRLALPFAAVRRLEDVDVASFETAGSERVLQSRGEVLRILSSEDLVDRGRSPGTPEHQSVVVVADDRSRVGFSVHRILDIVDAGIPVEGAPRRPGIAGCRIVQERVTEIVDVEALLQRVRAEAAAAPARVEAANR